MSFSFSLLFTLYPNFKTLKELRSDSFNPLYVPCISNLFCFKNKPKKRDQETSGVNFINILLETFSYESA
jgi:hypothetical protein